MTYAATTVTPTRNEALMQAVEEIQASLAPGEVASLVACIGPPGCGLIEDEACEAGRNGCVLCQRIVVGKELPRA